MVATTVWIDSWTGWGRFIVLAAVHTEPYFFFSFCYCQRLALGAFGMETNKQASERVSDENVVTST